MSIDLDVEICECIPAKALVDGTTKVLRRLVGIDPPELKIERVIDGKRLVTDHTLGGCDALYLLCFNGRSDAVTITVMRLSDTGTVSLSVAAGTTRTAPEFALALAASLFIGLEYNVEIRDGFMFWTSADKHKPDCLLELLTLHDVSGSFDDACARLMSSAYDAGCN